MTRLCLSLLAVLLASAAAAPATPPPDVRVGGFVSQGYLNTRRNEALMPLSEDGTAEMFEAALTVSADPLERLRVGVQILARNFGDQGNDRAAVDWAYLDYRWRDALGVRAGKVKLPFGLYNEERDIDLLRTGVFLPSAVYSEELRDLMLAYEGVGGYGSLAAGGAGQFDYHVFGGTLNVADADAGFWKSIFERQARDLAPLAAGAVLDGRGVDGETAEAEFVDTIDPRVTFPYVWGGALVWEPPARGLRLGASYLAGRFTYRTRFRYDVAVSPADGPPVDVVHLEDIDETWDIEHLATLSAEWTWRDLLLATEYYEENIRGVEALGWYALADWRVRPRLALVAWWSAAWPDRHDRDGRGLRAEVGLPAYYAWQKDLVVGARYDLNPHWLVKLEWHFIDGVAQIRADSLQEEIASPADRHWGMFAARTTVHF